MQLGSTAFNRSLGGAILQKGLPLMEMTEMAGIHHSQFPSLGPPFVMADDTIVKWQSDNFDGVLLGVDADVISLSGKKELVIKKTEDVKLHLIKGRHITDFERLAKLS